MKDLTQGPIFRQLIAMAAPIAAGMLLQTLYYVVDLYFVAQLGDAALAGVGAAGTAMFVVFALTQMLGVGTVALMSHAVGRKDRADANHVFNQSVALSALCAAITLGGGYGLSAPYMRWVGADAATAAAGVTYLVWFTPGLALQFALVAMGSALRGTGIVQPTMIVQALTVVLNIVLAPVLIAGWGTGHPLGVAGAALASTISIAAGVALICASRHLAVDTAGLRARPGLASLGGDRGAAGARQPSVAAGAIPGPARLPGSTRARDDGGWRSRIIGGRLRFFKTAAMPTPGLLAEGDSSSPPPSTAGGIAPCPRRISSPSPCSAPPCL